MGSIVQGLGGALFEAIDFADGKILNSNLSKYRLPRFKDVPKIEIVTIDRKDLPSAGAGEAAILGVAPAMKRYSRCYRYRPYHFTIASQGSALLALQMSGLLSLTTTISPSTTAVTPHFSTYANRINLFLKIYYPLASHSTSPLFTSPLACSYLTSPRTSTRIRLQVGQ